MARSTSTKRKKSALVYNFHECVKSMYEDGKVPLEHYVRIDMMSLGLNPNKREDVELYWSDLLDTEFNTPKQEHNEEEEV